MNIDNKTAVRYGFRAAFFGGYGPTGSRLAIICLTKAVEMNPNESLWHFMKAHHLGRLKRVDRSFDPAPSHEEFHHIEEALKIKRISIYTTHCAILYRNRAKTYLKESRANANELFKKCLELCR